jgi:hypothetical protein
VLYAREFFEELSLPFRESAVVGDSYLALLTPGSTGLRLRIDFAQTIVKDTYNGLRLSVVHPERGPLDSLVLRFEDHATFHRRDEAGRNPRGSRRYGTFTDFHLPDDVPWQGAVTYGLRDAIKRYVGVWSPGAWTSENRAPFSIPVPHSAPGAARHH